MSGQSPTFTCFSHLEANAAVGFRDGIRLVFASEPLKMDGGRPMAAQTIMAIPLENLLVDQDNPRHAPQPSQRQALAAIAQERGEKLTNLAADIWEKGLNPSDLPLVTYGEQDGRYVVVEGNRRICALKLMASPQLLASLGLPKKMNDRFKEIVKSPG